MDGAMQLTFRKMAFDYYPFHWAGMGILNGPFQQAQVLSADSWVHPQLHRRTVQGLAAPEILEIALLQTTPSGNFRVHYR